MKRSSLIVAVIICCFSSQSAISSQPRPSTNPSQVTNSDDSLVQAIKTIMKGGFLTEPIGLSHYVPGYGLNIALEQLIGVPKLNDTVERISTTLLEANSTVEGLSEEEWISVFFRGDGTDNRYDLIIRMKPNQPDTLEIWVDGLPRN